MNFFLFILVIKLVVVVGMTYEINNGSGLDEGIAGQIVLVAFKVPITPPQIFFCLIKSCY